VTGKVVEGCRGKGAVFGCRGFLRMNEK